ncbi:MAG: LirA/MavJ family T4SS effector [Cystobacter sp.]
MMTFIPAEFFLKFFNATVSQGDGHRNYREYNEDYAAICSFLTSEKAMAKCFDAVNRRFKDDLKQNGLGGAVDYYKEFSKSLRGRDFFKDSALGLIPQPMAARVKLNGAFSTTLARIESEGGGAVYDHLAKVTWFDVQKDTFVYRIENNFHLKDISASYDSDSFHGEYTHRLQWACLAYASRKGLLKLKHSVHDLYKLSVNLAWDFDHNVDGVRLRNLTMWFMCVDCIPSTPGLRLAELDWQRRNALVGQYINIEFKDEANWKDIMGEHKAVQASPSDMSQSDSFRSPHNCMYYLATYASHFDVLAGYLIARIKKRQAEFLAAGSGDNARDAYRNKKGIAADHLWYPQDA